VKGALRIEGFPSFDFVDLILWTQDAPIPEGCQGGDWIRRSSRLLPSDGVTGVYWRWVNSMTTDSRSLTTRPSENRFQLFSSESLSIVETVLYAALGLILSLAAIFALFMACQALWHGLGAESSAKPVVEVIDRLLVVLVLVEILHTVRISIRSHTLVTEPFLIVGLIATIRRMLVITLNAANLTSAADWTNNAQAKMRASMLELALLGGTVIVLVISIHILRKSKPSQEEQEINRADGGGSAQAG
jgi:uncharacterized membrane protein (DUF373 family)